MAELGFKDILSAIPSLAKGIAFDPLFLDSPDDDKFTFAEGSPQGIGNIGALTAAAPFAISELLPDPKKSFDSSPLGVAKNVYDQALDTIASEAVAPVKSLLGEKITPEEIREQLKQQRERKRSEELEATSLPKGRAAKIRKSIEDAVQKRTGFKGIEDIVEETSTTELPFLGEVELPSKVNLPGALGLGIGTLAGGAALSAVPVLGGAGVEGAIEGSIANQLAKLGVTEGSKRAIASQIGGMGVGNAIAGSPLTLAAAQREDGSLDAKELTTGLALDALFGAGLGAAGIGALKFGGKAVESIQDLTNHLKKRTNKIAEQLPIKKQVRQQVQAEEAELIARGIDPDSVVAGQSFKEMKPKEVYHGTNAYELESLESLDPDRSGGMLFFAEERPRAETYALGAGGQRRRLRTQDQLAVDSDSGVAYSIDEKSGQFNPVGRVPEKLGDSFDESSLESLSDYEVDNFPSMSIEEGEDLVDRGLMAIVPKRHKIFSADISNKNILDLTNQEGVSRFLESFKPTTQRGQDLRDSAIRSLRDGDPSEFNTQLWTTTKFGNSRKSTMSEIKSSAKDLGFEGIRFADDEGVTVGLFENPSLVEGRSEKLTPVSESIIEGGGPAPTPEIEQVRTDVQAEIDQALAQTDQGLQEIDQLKVDIPEPAGGTSKEASFLFDSDVKSRGPVKKRVDNDNFFEGLVQPVVSRVRNINPALAGKLRKFEFDYRGKANAYKRKVLPFVENKNRLFSDADKEAFKVLSRNSDADGLEKLFAKYAGSPEGAELQQQFRVVRNVLDDLHQQAGDAGRDIGFVENYFPSKIKDHDQFMKAVGAEKEDPIRKAWFEKENDLGRELTKQEKSDIANKVLIGSKRDGVSGPSFSKKRVFEMIDGDEVIKTPDGNEVSIASFYQDPDKSLMDYIDQVSYDIETRNFLGKGDNIENSIGNTVTELIDQGEIDFADARTLQDLLKARFINANKGPSEPVKLLRDVNYLATLGNPMSTITQFSDLGLSAFLNGTDNTFAALADTIRGKNLINLEDLNIDDIAAELSDPGVVGKWLDKTLDITQFKNVDKLGKTTAINSAYKQMRRAAKKGKGRDYDTLVKEANEVFGAEAPQLLEDLRKGNYQSDNVRLALFNRLSEVQPISLSEMPEAYLNSPNGRLFYSLKSFTLKQIDLMRNKFLDDLYEGAAKGNAKQVTQAVGDLIRFGTLFGGSIMGTNIAKDYIQGRPIEMTDEMLDAALSTMALSRYNIYKIKNEGLGSAVKNYLFSFPTPVFDSMTKDIDTIVSGEFENPLMLDSVKLLPVVGKNLYWSLGAGGAKNQREREKKLKEKSSVRDPRLRKRLAQIEKRKKKIKAQVAKRLKRLKKRR